MTIQKDSGEILLLIYNKYINPKERFSHIRFSEILKETNWNESRLDRAIEYLKQKKFIETFFGGQMDFIVSPTSEGIDVIENKNNKFKRNFGFETGLPGLFKFSWGATEV